MPTNAMGRSAPARSEHPSPISEGEIEELRRLHDACGPAWPLRIEEDWTAEIYGADGSLIAKVMYPKEMRHAELLVKARNALPRLLSALSRCGRDEAIEEVLRILESERQGYENLMHSSDNYARGNNSLKECALNDAIQSIRSLLSADREKGSRA